MKGMKSCLPILFSISVLILTSNLAVPSEEHQLPEVPRIDATMAYYMYKQGSVVLIDAMNPVAFATKHILGSINIPMNGPQDLERLRNMELPFPKEKVIVVYCM